MRTIRVGSRESRLAVAQTNLVVDAIRRRHPEIVFEVVAMKTSGDRLLERPLAEIGGKGLFIKELDEALIAGEVDFCVHSYKDMPVPDNPELPVLAVSAREDPRDVLILPAGGGEATRDKPLGTSSLRRRHQLAALFPDWECEPVRGNLLTRLRKLDEGRYGALVLAAAGLRRLGMAERISRFFSVDEIIPASCQGMLAVQGRAGEEYPYLACLEDRDARDASLAERAYVEKLDGGCSSPTAAYASLSGDDLTVSALHVDKDGNVLRRKISGRRGDAARLGMALAEQMKTECGHG